jgi:hypothetical protein
MFNQSFDSKLSEFSNNSEILVLSKPQGISEARKNSTNRVDEYNSLKKQLQRPDKKVGLGDLDDANDYLDNLEEANAHDPQQIKNFTFSKNKGTMSPNKKEGNLETQKGNKNTNSKSKYQKKIILSLESPKNVNKMSRVEKTGNKSKAKPQLLMESDDEEPFELCLPIQKKKQKNPKFMLDLSLVEDANNEDDRGTTQIPPKPPSLGKHKKFNMAGSSFCNQNFSLGTGQQHRLNAPRNNSKKTFSFNSDLINRNLRNNFKLPNTRDKFQPALEIVIPEENSREIEGDISEEPSLELPSLKDRQHKNSTKNKKKFNLAIEVEDNEPKVRRTRVQEKIILVDEFQDSVSKSLSSKEKEAEEQNGGRLGLTIGKDRTSSNSPRHVSGIQKSIEFNLNRPLQWSKGQPAKNLEIPFDSELINMTMGNKTGTHNDLFSACRTNPLPTTKNANLKNRCFEFGGTRKKRHLTVSLTGDEVFSTKNEKEKKKKRNLCIDEVSNDEMQSNSGEDKLVDLNSIKKKRNLKMKINTKNSDKTNKNYSKQSSQIINSIQSKK